MLAEEREMGRWGRRVKEKKGSHSFVCVQFSLLVITSAFVTIQ
jgi:hypothetical protein